MARRAKSTITLVILIAFGAVIGSVLAELARGSRYFDWLSFGRQFGISTENPLSLNLGVLSLKFGLMFHITVATVLSVIVTVFVYKRI
ncbi:MAG: DUF4321 domain-containing protein [Clostridiales bacterium]|jgi:hypothetical protein|nr:DUF4321 domain-containing protein [Clostridiales bacterium]